MTHGMRRIAVVTGAVEGIGWATAQGLAADGFDIVLVGRTDDDRLKLRTEELERAGAAVLPVAADVTDSDATAELYRTVFSTYRQLDALVASAGVLGDARLGMISEQLLHETFEINAMGAIRHLQAAARLMTKGRHGSIVLVGSIIGTVGNPGQIVYAATKAAVIGAVRAAAKELGPSGVRVNAVAPGYIDTRMISHLPPDVHAQRIAGIALGRSGQADEVAEVIRFLCSDSSRYVTGQVIGVDGGMVL